MILFVCVFLFIILEKKRNNGMFYNYISKIFFGMFVMFKVIFYVIKLFF